MKRNPSHLLAIDIGNSSISCGFFKNGALKRVFYGNLNVIPQIDSLINKSGVKRSNYKVIISSVNPNKLNKVLKPLRRTQVIILGRQITPKIKHKYLNYNKLGKDRLVNLYGAARFYKVPVLFFNFGTALTCDYVSRSGTYEGGLIIPGIETSWLALQEKAALLPKIPKVSACAGFIGRDTKSCMQLGLLQGFGAMVDGLIERFERKFGKKMTVIGAGGLARVIRPYIKHPIKIDQKHPLKSLALIYNDYKK